MLATRLTNDLHRNGAINRANEGFLKQKSTGNVLTTILNVWEDAREHNKSCYNLSYDVSKAYDHLRWFTIRDGMERINLPEKFKVQEIRPRKNERIEDRIQDTLRKHHPFRNQTGHSPRVPVIPTHIYHKHGPDAYRPGENPTLQY